MKTEQLKSIISEVLQEVTYNKFKNETKFRTRSEQIHKAVKMIKENIKKVDKLVEFTTRMRTELSEDEGGLRYWKATSNNVAQIAEMVNTLNNKIKGLTQ